MLPCDPPEVKDSRTFMSERFDVDSEPYSTRKITLRLFGFSPTSGNASLQPRSVPWRLARTGFMLAITAVVAPLVFLVPPHAPWGVGALLGGLILSRRRWMERATISDVSAPCPKCGHEVRIRKASRLRDPHTMTCDHCHHESILEVEGSIETEHTEIRGTQR